MLQILGRGAQRCLARSRLPSSSLCSLSTGRSLATSLRTVRFNSSLSQPPTPPPGFTAELLKPALSEKPRAPPSILDKVVPKWAEKAKPYLHLIRADKPIGSILLFWPGAWGIMMASTIHHLPPSVPASLTALFAVGAVVMRGAGCTINDMWDEKFDRAVERTRWRPLAAGDVTRFQALTFLGAQLLVGLDILTQLNMYTIGLGVASMGLVTIYPFMKRITYYPQITFGATFMWAILMGWSAAAGHVDWVMALPMYVGGVAWGVAYDCIYAHQDKVDDVKVGVKSIALAFPDTSRSLITALNTGFVSSLALTGYLAGMGPLYYAISCGGAAAHLAWQCATVDFDSRLDCWRKFCSNGWLGGLIWLGMAAEYVSSVVIPGAF